MIKITLPKELEKFRPEYSYSESVINKAIEIFSTNRIRLVSPCDARGIHFHICPRIEDDQKKGYDVIYLQEVNEWLCDCKHEVYRKDRKSICSHILASMQFWKEVKR